MTETVTRSDNIHWGKDDIIAVGIDIQIEKADIIFTDVRLTDSAFDQKELDPPIFYKPDL